MTKDHFRAQVLTGPVFDDKDPVLPGFDDTPFPLRFWKVVAAINASDKLFATAYLLDQRGVIAEFGIGRPPRSRSPATRPSRRRSPRSCD